MSVTLERTRSGHSESPFLQGDVWAFLDDDAPGLLRAYFHSSYFFTGAAFHTFAAGGDAPACEDLFTANDVIAVSLLGVRIPGRASLALLELRAAELNGMLARIPSGEKLWEVDPDVVGPDSEANRLWQALRSIDGIEWVTAHKLLARKRPHLLPVYDSVVRQALQPADDAYWLPLRNDLLDRDQGLVERLRQLRADAGLSQTVPLLRVLDVAVWMRNFGFSYLPENERPTNAPLPYSPRPSI